MLFFFYSGSDESSDRKKTLSENTKHVIKEETHGRVREDLKERYACAY